MQIVPKLLTDDTLNSYRYEVFSKAKNSEAKKVHNACKLIKVSFYLKSTKVKNIGYLHVTDFHEERGNISLYYLFFLIFE